MSFELITFRHEGISVPMFRTDKGMKTLADLLTEQRQFLVQIREKVLLIALDWRNAIQVKGSEENETALVPFPVMERKRLSNCFPENAPQAFREMVVELFACDRNQKEVAK